MAEVILNPAFTSLRGRIGSLVFYSFGGRTLVRTHVIPRNPDTPSQRENRDLFGKAMKAWQRLSAFDRESFSRRARRLGMTGHNLFISRYMASHRNDVRSDVPGPGIIPGFLSLILPYSSFNVPGPSVSGSTGRPSASGAGNRGTLSVPGP